MKSFNVILLAAIFLCSGSALLGQQTQRDVDKAIKDRASKAARKDARKLGKEGWYVPPGTLPLDKQLQRSFEKQYQLDDQGNDKYIFGIGNGVGESKTAAELQAVEVGKLLLAGSIETQMSALVSANIGNAQLSTTDAASVTEVVASAKNMIAMELGYINPIVKLYKDLPGDKVEVQVYLAYEVKQSLDIAKKVVRKELKDKLKMNEQQLEKLMGMDK